MTLLLTCAASPAPPSPPSPPRGPSIKIEPTYKLGQRPAPREPAEPASINAWNRGGRGDPPAPERPPEGHPLPRVIITVDRVKGPLKARDVQSRARAQLWGKVIGCYRLVAYREPTLRGKVTARWTVSRSGKVTAAKTAAAELPSKEVASCLVQTGRALSLPKRRSGSSATATIWIAPGDDPVEPPAAVVTPGDGALPPEAIATAVGGALPSITACYEAALADAPALWGRLAIRFHVTAAGVTDEAFQVESSFPDERLVQCVLRRARAIAFPAPQGGDVRFVVPLRLSPGGAAVE